MELKIKNMVCDRCILSVEKLLDESGIESKSIGLGKVELVRKLNPELGFELLEDKESQYVEAVKNAITDLIYNQEDTLKKYTISAFIEERVGREYKWLSQLFSNKEGDTIEHYVIAQKIERVKELLSYESLTISEIADKLHYSSVAHLSNQFKKITGYSPSQFKNFGERKPLDKI
jgi:AraC family transcriptional regulator